MDIARADAPPTLKFAAGHECVREVAGHPYLVTVWTQAEWDRLPEPRRPATAQRIGTLGYLDMGPATGP